MVNLADYIERKIETEREEIIMRKKTARTILVPLFMAFAVLLIASCTTPETNSTELEAPQWAGSDADVVYRDGLVEYSFMVEVPSACHELIVEERVLESYPEQIEIDVKMRQTEEMCAQVITQKEVTGEIALANPPARFSVLLKGEPAYTEDMERDIEDDWRIEGVSIVRDDVSLNYEFQLNLPNPCHTYRIDESIVGNELTLAVTIVPPKSDVMCIEVIDQQIVEGSVPQKIDMVRIFIDSKMVYEESFN
jgi:hypothetical protein